MKIKFDIWKGNLLSSYILNETELNEIVFEHLVDIGHISEERQDEYEINISEVLM